jgi:hypothetical protein
MVENWPKRFSSKVEIRGPDDCWLWQAVLIPGGYGQFWFEGRMRNSHVMAVIFSGTKIPEGEVVMHTCDVRRCCNPKHLVVGTQANNIDDMVRKNRGAKGESHGSVLLTESDVRKIRLKLETAAEAAKKYGVSRAAVNDIRQGISWKHIV